MLLLVIGGTIVGITVGALPGLTATMGVAILLPVTFYLTPEKGMMILLGIYVGGIYGGSIAAILMNIPGCPASIMTTLDGYPMTQKGEGGRAIGIATTASFVGGTFGVLALMFIAPILARFALSFGPPEYAMLAFFGLSAIVMVAAKSIVKGFIGVVLGLLMATVGMDPVVSVPRFTFGSIDLMTGINYIPVVIGLFGLAEVLGQILTRRKRDTVKQKLKRVIPTLPDLKKIFRNSFYPCWMGTFIGALPGAGATIAAIISYNRAVQTAKEPDRFGTGIPEGLIACETANNATIGGAMVPLLTLGIPGSAVTAVLLGAFMMHNIQPGPLLFIEHANLVYIIFVGLIVANVAMLVFGIAGAKVIPRVVNLPKDSLLPTIALLCIVGAFALNNSLFEVGIMVGSGIIGFLLREIGISAGPIILGLILGPIAESNFRGALELSAGNPLIFVTRPVSVVVFILTVGLFTYPFIRNTILKRKEGKAIERDDLILQDEA